MDHFDAILNRITKVSVFLAGSILLGVIALIVTSIITRRFGWAIPGSYEIIELVMPVVVGFALGYAALTKSHVVVDLVVSRLPQRIRTVAESFTFLIGLGILVGVTWAGADLLQKRWLVEQTDEFGIPFAPFRIIWLCGLCLFCLILLINLVRLLGRQVRK